MLATAVGVFVIFFIITMIYAAIDKVSPGFWKGCSACLVSIIAWVVLIALVTAIISVF